MNYDEWDKLDELDERGELDELDELDDLDAQRCISVQAVAPSILFRLAGWTGRVEVIIMLSQLSTKLKLKLKLSLAIIMITSLSWAGVNLSYSKFNLDCWLAWGK